MITVLLLSPSLDVTYLVDAVVPGTIHRPRRVVRLAGGKGLNLARAAARSGGTAGVVAPLGGRIGDLVASLAESDGIAVTRVTVGEETRSCVTVIPDSGDGVEFYEPASELTATETAAVGGVLAAAPRGGWTVLSGSVPTSVDPADVVAMLRERADRGERIAVDTHGDVLRCVVAELRPDLVKVNRAEATELLGTDAAASALDLADALRTRTGGTVIVTDGVEGSACVAAHGAWRVEPHPSPGRFAVGSGDSFLAGLLVGLERGDAVPDALALASATASANAATPGGALFDLAALEAERRTVRVVTA